MCPDPKNIKIKSSCQYLFELLGSAGVKSARKMLVKLAPVPTTKQHSFQSEFSHGSKRQGVKFSKQFL
jgi:hypothetical protein